LLDACEFVIERYNNDSDNDACNDEEVAEIKKQNRAEIDRKKADLYLGLLDLGSEFFVYKAEGVGVEGKDGGDVSVGGGERDKHLVVNFNEVLVLDDSNIKMLNVDEIDKFVSSTKQADLFVWARDLFKECVASLTSASKFFVLDGYVTDHVDICLQRSRAYKFLARCESDEKRKGAMMQRRAAALEPLLKDLNEQAYLGLHKTLSYEVGTSYMDMLDLKLYRIEKKMNDSPTGYVMKKSEVSGVAASEASQQPPSLIVVTSESLRSRLTNPIICCRRPSATNSTNPQESTSRTL